MELHRTEQGFALYKEKDCIGECTLSPAPKGRTACRPVHPAPVAAQGLRLLPVKRSIAQLWRL